MGHQNPGQNVFRGTPANRLLTDGKGLPDRRMRLGVGFGNDTDALDITVLVYFSSRAVFSRPVLGHRPAADTFIIGSRHLIIFTLESHGVLGPGHFHDLEDLLEHRPVVSIHFGPVHRCASYVVMLPEDIGPAVLVAAGKAGDEPSLGEMVKDRNLLSHPDGVPGR